MIKKQDDFNNENIYIGSTCNFIRRKNMHKSTCNNENCIEYNYKLYKYIRENDGWDAWIMTKIIDYDCNNKSELNIMERRYIDSYKCKLNCIIPTRTRKERYNDNKEKFLQYQKEHYETNKNKILERQKQYNNDNKDKIVEQHKQYRKDNVDKIAKYQKEYIQNNKEKLSQKYKDYYEANKDKILEKKKERVICDNCGCESTKCILERHKRSLKCINFNSK